MKATSSGAQSRGWCVSAPMKTFSCFHETDTSSRSHGYPVWSPIIWSSGKSTAIASSVSGRPHAAQAMLERLPDLDLDRHAELDALHVERVEDAVIGSEAEPVRVAVHADEAELAHAPLELPHAARDRASRPARP